MFSSNLWKDSMSNGILVQQGETTVFNSNYPAIQILTAASVNQAYAGAASSQHVSNVTTINHNLGYQPVAYIYVQSPDGNIVPVNPSGGVQFYQNTTAQMVLENNDITVTVKNFGLPAPAQAAFNYTVYYYIIELPIYLNNDFTQNVSNIYG